MVFSIRTNIVSPGLLLEGKMCISVFKFKENIVGLFFDKLPFALAIKTPLQLTPILLEHPVVLAQVIPLQWDDLR
jgi:hypothetical protein